MTDLFTDKQFVDLEYAIDPKPPQVSYHWGGEPPNCETRHEDQHTEKTQRIADNLEEYLKKGINPEALTRALFVAYSVDENVYWELFDIAMKIMDSCMDKAYGEAKKFNAKPTGEQNDK